MNVCVFLGPTLPVEEAARILDAVYLPPAAQGDVLMATDDGADVIGIVDGYFQGAPSVWHKEILWAMSRGVRVLGSSSMGALRAAELAEFGMQGVGRVFEAYRDGVIEDDDEVAVVHGPQEMAYRPRTVPLVNMRVTLDEAMGKKVITRHAHDRIVEVARSMFYWDRTYEALMEKSRDAVDQVVLRDLAGWIESNAVDQKREDAVALLEIIAKSHHRPLEASFQFQRTSAFDDLVDDVRERRGDRSAPASPPRAARVLDELRLEPELYVQIAAMPRVGTDGGHEDSMLAALAESGHYDYFAERANDKQRTLDEQFGAAPAYADVMLTPSEVLEWYFEDCHGKSVPMDLDHYATELGMTGSAALCRLLLHELIYAMSREEDRAIG